MWCLGVCPPKKPTPVSLAHWGRERKRAKGRAWQLFLPLVYIFTPWLSFADYHLPDWAGWLGVVILAGVGGLILFLPMYVIRMPQEEQMMIGQFGDVYRAYMQRTGRVLPPWHKN